MNICCVYKHYKCYMFRYTIFELCFKDNEQENQDIVCNYFRF